MWAEEYAFKAPGIVKTVRKSAVGRVHIKTFKSIQTYGAKNMNLKIRFKRDAVKTLGLR